MNIISFFVSTASRLVPFKCTHSACRHQLDSKVLKCKLCLRSKRSSTYHCTSNHISMAWSIDDSAMPLCGVEFLGGVCDRHTTLTLHAQALLPPLVSVDHASTAARPSKRCGAKLIVTQGGGRMLKPKCQGVFCACGKSQPLPHTVNAEPKTF